MTAAPMSTSLAVKLAELESLNTAALRAEWRRLLRSQSPSLSRDLLTRAIGHRYQELEHGGLSKAVARKLRSIADTVTEAASTENAASASEWRRSPSPRTALLPGARLIREWHGRTHIVTVADAGFDYAGNSYRSLTEIAKTITGTHWSGPRFFGLGTAREKGRAKLPLDKAASPTVSAKRKAAPHG